MEPGRLGERSHLKSEGSCAMKKQELKKYWELRTKTLFPSWLFIRWHQISSHSIQGLLRVDANLFLKSYFLALSHVFSDLPWRCVLFPRNAAHSHASVPQTCFLFCPHFIFLAKPSSVLDFSLPLSTHENFANSSPQPSFTKVNKQ